MRKSPNFIKEKLDINSLFLHAPQDGFGTGNINIIYLKKIMKGILEFDLNDVDDIMAHKCCVKSNDMALALWDIRYNIGKSLERRLENDSTSTDKDYELLEFVKTEILDIFDTYGILIDELVN